MKGEGVGANVLTKVSDASACRLATSFFPVVALGEPYWNAATYRAILRSLFSASVIDGRAINDLRSLLIETLGVEDARLCSSGSCALEIALRGCGVGKDDEVVIPTFCCSAVVPPILAVGALPVLADIGPELNLTVETVDTVLTRKTKAVIVPHLFGNPADIGAIVALARAKNIRVIDDAAQAFGATIDRRAVGTFGDVGIISFGKEKICSGLAGGAVLSVTKGFQAGDLTAHMPQPTLWPTMQNLFSTLLWRCWRRWTLAVQKTLFHEDSPRPDLPPPTYRMETIANLNAAVALTLMQTLCENIAARRARIQVYRKFLGDVSGLELIEHRPGSAGLAQVIRITPRRRSEDSSLAVVAALARAGYEVQGSYVPLHHLSSCAMCVWDRLPYADRVWPDLIELPCEPGITVEKVARIAEIVRTTLSP